MMPFSVQDFFADVSPGEVNELSLHERRTLQAWINAYIASTYLDSTDAIMYQRGAIDQLQADSKLFSLGSDALTVQIAWNYADYAFECSLGVALAHINELCLLAGDDDVYIVNTADLWIIQMYHEGYYFFAKYPMDRSMLIPPCLCLEGDSEILVQRIQELERLSGNNVLHGRPPFSGVTLTDKGELTWISNQYPLPHKRVDLREAIIRNAQLCHMRLIGAWFDRAHLSDTDLRFATLAMASFGHCSMHNVSFSHANLLRARFDYAKLRGIDLSQATLRETSWIGVEKE